MNRPEVLCPAGTPEKLRAAVRFGADAVYLSGKDFGLRAGAGNFDAEELSEAIKFCHSRGVKAYLTLNTMPRANEYDRLRRYIAAVNELGPDAYIVADPGVMDTLHGICPGAVIHVSTQTSVVSPAAAESYMRHFNARRVVLARELSLEEIKNIRKNVSAELELETFVHGAMCVSWSGRCLLSNHFTGRDGNRGECAQPCRWNYRLYELREERDDSRRPGIEQTDEGTFIMSSRDLCMIEHVPELYEAGIASFKIEGRMKSVYYAAVTALAYKKATVSYAADPDHYENDPELLRMLGSVTHRKYDTGYYFADPGVDAKIVDEPGYLTERPYYGIVVGYDDLTGVARIKQKNKVVSAQTVRFLTPDGETAPFRITEMTDADGQSLISTPHPGMIYGVKVPYPVGEGDILH